MEFFGLFSDSFLEFADEMSQSAEHCNQRGNGEMPCTSPAKTTPEPSPLAGKGDKGRTASTSKAGSGASGSKTGKIKVKRTDIQKGQTLSVPPKPKAVESGGEMNSQLCKRIESLEKMVAQMVDCQRFATPTVSAPAVVDPRPQIDTDYDYPGPTGDYPMEGIEENDYGGSDFDHHSSDLSMSSDSYLPAHHASATETTPVPAIAAKFIAPKDVGEPIDGTIAQTANYLVANQMGAKTLEEVSGKYPLPDNCQLIDTPKVNPIIWDNLPPNTRTRDLKIQRVQKSLSKGLNAFLRTVPSDNLSDTQQDALALLCNAQFELNCLRKDFIKPDLNSRYAHLCKPSTPVTRLLFGDNLSKQVKEMKDQQLATAGVTKGQGRPRTHERYHPYQGRAMTQQRHYAAAGWNTGKAYRPFSATTDSRPFLGHRQERGRPPPPSQPRSQTRSQAPATQTRPSHSQGTFPKRK